MPYRHFTSDERDALQIFIDKGLPVLLIARILEKHISSIYREIKRNSSIHLYLFRYAEHAAEVRKTRSRHCYKRANVQLIQEIETRVKEDHSPEQIAGRLKLEHPDSSQLQVSHETIYQYIYSKVRNGSDDLRLHLRQSRKVRRKRSFGKRNRGGIANRHFIDERPSVVEEKSRIGDWEGDTVEGANNSGNVATFVDRSSKYLVAFPLREKLP